MIPWVEAAILHFQIDPNEVNEYDVPFHACNGVIQDSHYWVWVRQNLVRYPKLAAYTRQDEREVLNAV